MTGFTVYSSEYTPQRLYSDGDTEGIGTDLVEEIVRFGDRPLDLYVNLSQRQILWSFKAERHTKSARTGYFVAAYQSDGEDLFRNFENKLRCLHDSDEWAIPHTGELRWDIGFELWRIPAEVPGLSTDQFQELTDRLRQEDRARPIEFGMRTHRSALQIVRALDEADVSCTVTVGGGGDPSTLSDVDLHLQPGGESDFEPLSTLAAEIEEMKTIDETTEQIVSENLHRGQNQSGSLLSRLSGAILLVFLGFAGYSFIEPSPVRPLTGLSTLGGLIGSLVALTLGTWLLNREQSQQGIEWAADAVLAETDRSLILVAYGTLLGFGFPRIMWEAGVIMGRNGFPFGSITTLFGSSLSVSVYVLGIFSMSSVIAIAQSHASGLGESLTSFLPVLTVCHIVYGVSLILATGFASSIWFALIPSATV